MEFLWHSPRDISTYVNELEEGLHREVYDVDVLPFTPMS